MTEPTIAPLQAELAETREEISSLRAQLTIEDRRSANVQAQRDAAEALAADLQRKRDRLNLQNATLQGNLNNTRAELIEARETVVILETAVATEIVNSKTALAEKTTALNTAEAELFELRRLADRTAEALKDAALDMERVTIFVTSKERIQKYAGELWWANCIRNCREAIRVYTAYLERGEKG